MSFPQIVNLGGLGALAAVIAGILFWLIKAVMSENKASQKFLQNHMTTDQRLLTEGSERHEREMTAIGVNIARAIQEYHDLMGQHTQEIRAVRLAIEAQTNICRTVREQVLLSLRADARLDDIPG